MTAAEPVGPTDLDLVRLARAGDTAAFGELVERHRRAVFRTALAAVGNASDAEDVAQDAFITAHRKLAGFRGEAAFKTWLLSIAWRKALDRRKGVRRWLRLTVSPHDFGDDAADVFDRIAAPGRSHEEEFAGRDLHRELRRLVASLPRKLRDPLLLAGSGEHSYQEIAEMLGAPLGTIKWRISEARRVLRVKLAGSGSRFKGF